eukprot:596652-Pleurochrysis_carterae.AAC.1
MGGIIINCNSYFSTGRVQVREAPQFIEKVAQVLQAEYGGGGLSSGQAGGWRHIFFCTASFS